MLDQLPSWIWGLLISLVTSLIVFNGAFAGLKTTVEANTDKIKNAVPRSEFEVIIKNQEKMEELMNKRMDKLEGKIDKIGDRVR